MGVLNHSSLPNPPSGDSPFGIRGNIDIDVSNAENWSSSWNQTCWLAQLLAKQPEVDRIVWIRGFSGQEEENEIQFLLTDGTPILLSWPESEAIARGRVDDEEDY